MAKAVRTKKKSRGKGIKTRADRAYDGWRKKAALIARHLAVYLMTGVSNNSIDMDNEEMMLAHQQLGLIIEFIENYED